MPSIETAKRIEYATNGAVSAVELLGVAAPSVPTPKGVSEETAYFAQALPLDPTLLEEAASYGLDAADIAHRAVERAVKAERMKRFSEENREAIESWNEHYRKHGLWSDGYRLF